MGERDYKGTDLVRCEDRVNQQKCIVGNCGQPGLETLPVSGHTVLGYVSFNARLCTKHKREVENGLKVQGFSVSGKGVKAESGK